MENINMNYREFFSSNRTWKLIGVVVLILILVKMIGGGPDWKGGDKITSMITVSGKGEVIVKPDIATISFGVTAENLDVAKAQEESATKINKIIDFLKTSGVEEKDIKTVNYSVYPRYDYVNSKTYPYNGKQVLAGYTVSQSVEVKIREIKNAGAILSGVGEFGVTDVGGLNFSVDKYDEEQNKARTAAIKDARAQAEVLAKSLGVKLVRITSFSENGNYPMYYAKEMSAMGGDMMVAPQVPTGENKITSNVSITYEIR